MVDYRDELARNRDSRRKDEDHKRMKIMVFREPEVVPYDDFDPDVPYDQRDGEVWVDAEYQVCTACEGRGEYVNPSIDSHGITGEEMHEMGDDFQEDYASGRFNVTCDRCDGRRVMLVALFEALTDELREKIEEQEEADAAYAAMCASERRMGA